MKHARRLPWLMCMWMANSRYYHCWTLTPSSKQLFSFSFKCHFPFSTFKSSFYLFSHSLSFIIIIIHTIYQKHFSFNTNLPPTPQFTASFFPSIFILLFSYIFILFSYCVQQTVKAKEHKTSCERYIELKMENNKFIVKHERMRVGESGCGVFFRKGEFI